MIKPTITQQRPRLDSWTPKGPRRLSDEQRPRAKAAKTGIPRGAKQKRQARRAVEGAPNGNGVTGVKHSGSTHDAGVK